MKIYGVTVLDTYGIGEHDYDCDVTFTGSGVYGRETMSRLFTSQEEAIDWAAMLIQNLFSVEVAASDASELETGFADEHQYMLNFEAIKDVLIESGFDYIQYYDCHISVELFEQEVDC